MTIEEIRKNKPDGATHYNNEPDYSAVCYWMVVDGWVESWSDDDKCWLTYKNVKSYNDFMLSEIKPLH